MNTDRNNTSLAGTPTPSTMVASPRVVVAPHEEEEHVSLCEALDRLLHKGAVLKGEITISVANVDLVYLGFHMLLASVETARGLMTPPAGPGVESSPSTPSQHAARALDQGTDA